MIHDVTEGQLYNAHECASRNWQNNIPKIEPVSSAIFFDETFAVGDRSPHISIRFQTFETERKGFTCFTDLN